MSFTRYKFMALAVVGLGCMTSGVAHASYDLDAKWQIALCWNMPVDSKPVEIALEVNKNGIIQSAEVVDKAGLMEKDPDFKAGAEAVLQAVHNPKCSILDLPEDKYDDWKHLDITFNPGDVL